MGTQRYMCSATLSVGSGVPESVAGNMRAWRTLEPQCGSEMIFRVDVLSLSRSQRRAPLHGGKDFCGLHVHQFLQATSYHNIT